MRTFVLSSIAALLATGAFAQGAGGFPPLLPQSGTFITYHGCHSIDGPDIDFTVSGTGASWSTGGGLSTVPCAAIGVTGTTTTGVAMVGAGNLGAIAFGSGEHEFGAGVLMDVVSDGTNRYEIKMGFFDTTTSGSNGTDGCFCHYSDNINSGNWEAVCIDNSVATTATLTSAGTSSAYVFCKVQVDATASTARFSLINNGTLTSATISSNVPGASRPTTFGAYIGKSLGTTSRSLAVDFLYYLHTRGLPWQ